MCVCVYASQGTMVSSSAHLQPFFVIGGGVCARLFLPPSFQWGRSGEGRILVEFFAMVLRDETTC